MSGSVQTGTQSARGGIDTEKHWRVVGTVCVGAFMAAVDASIVNVALPTIENQFGLSLAQVAWVSLIYLLVLAGLIVPFGRLSDMYGRKWMYTTGFGIFILGSALCGFAMNIVFLLVARGIQAVGASLLQANSISIITANTPSYHRGKAIGFQASAQGIGLSIGPAVGGLILSGLSWRWIFFVNVPVGILGTVLGVFLLPKDHSAGAKERFDFMGGISLTPAVVALIYLLNAGFKNGIHLNIVLPLLALTFVFLSLFIWIESRSENPLMDLRLFRNSVVTHGVIGGVLSFAVMYAVIFLMPFFFERVQYLSTFASGLYLCVIPLGMTLSTPFSGAVTDKFGWRLPTSLGMALAMAGSLALANTGGSLSQLLLLSGLFLVGTGLGVYTPPNNSSVMGAVGAKSLGVAGGMLNMARTLGMSFGVTLGGLFYESFLSLQGQQEETKATVEQMIRSYHNSFYAVLVLAAIPFLMAVWPKSKKTK